MTDIPFNKRISHHYKGVDRCSSRNEAIGEATNICTKVVNETANAIGASVKNDAIDIDLIKHSHNNKKDKWTGKRSCKAHIEFDCKATLIQ